VSSVTKKPLKGKGVPSSINEGWVPGGDPGPSPPQVAFSRAGAIQRLDGRSIRRTCGLPSQLLNTATRLTDESAVAIRGEFLAKENYATTARQQNRSRTPLGYELRSLSKRHVYCFFNVYCVVLIILNNFYTL